MKKRILVYSHDTFGLGNIRLDTEAVSAREKFSSVAVRIRAIVCQLSGSPAVVLESMAPHPGEPLISSQRLPVSFAAGRRVHNPVTVITYGTFDLLHVGHINLLRRARALGDRLIVGLSTDEFNQMKSKDVIVPYHDRLTMLQSLRFVDMVIPETTWDQKPLDIQEYAAAKLVMGHDWEGKFDHLRRYCDVVYLPRTEDVSTTLIKEVVQGRHPGNVMRLRASR